MSTAISVVSLVGIAWLLTQYKRESVEQPGTSLPLQDLVDVRQYRHDGRQTKVEQNGNSPDTVEWPEVHNLLSYM